MLRFMDGLMHCTADDVDGTDTVPDTISVHADESNKESCEFAPDVGGVF